MEDKEKLSRSPKNDQCNYCKERGHWVRDFKKWKKDSRPKGPGANIKSTTAVASSAMLITVTEDTPLQDSDWWIDHGATRHITNSPKYFMTFEKFDNTYVITAVGQERLKAVGKGTIKVKSEVNGIF